MIVTCIGCNASFNLEDERVKQTGSKVRCSICKSVFMVYPPVAVEEQDLAENIEKQETEVPQVKSEGLSLTNSEDIGFSETSEAVKEKQSEAEDSAETDKGKELSAEEELDFSDLGESIEKQEPALDDISADEDIKKPELSDSEDIDFSELEKMLENGEISFDNLLAEESEGEIKFSDTEEIDLSDLDAAIDKIEDTDFEETEEEARELKLELGGDQESQILKTGDIKDLDFSDLEAMIDFNEISDSSGINEKTADITTNINFETEQTSAEQESEQETDALDFSDLEKMLENGIDTEEPDAKPSEDNAELSLEINQAADDRQELKFEDTVALENESLDFSDLEKMLETEAVSSESGKKRSDEDLELSLEMESPANSRQNDNLPDTIAFDDMKLDFQSDETEQEDAFAKTAGYGMAKIHDSEEAEEETIDAASLKDVQDIRSYKTEPFKEMPPPIKKNFFGKFSLIFGVILALLLSAGAFIYYNPFGIDIPVVGEYIESKVDKTGNLKITPDVDSLKGNYIDTKSGTVFVITGQARNDYKNPRSYIKLTGKIFKKGRVLAKTESVYCGNIISEQDLLDIEPAVLKKRLQNKFGINKSNVNVKPKSKIPFMIIFENPSPDLDEFIVEAESSTRQ